MWMRLPSRPEYRILGPGAGWSQSVYKLILLSRSYLGGEETREPGRRDPRSLRILDCGLASPLGVPGCIAHPALGDAQRMHPDHMAFHRRPEGPPCDKPVAQPRIGTA